PDALLGACGRFRLMKTDPGPERPTPGKRRRNARELEETVQRLEALLDVSRTIAAQESLDSALAALVRVTTNAVGAERATLLLNEPETDELYSRVAGRNTVREIRIPNKSGIAGEVFADGKGKIANDVQADERFNRDVDEETGFTTRSVLCAPIRTVKG